MIVTLQYRAGHSIASPWVKTELHCLQCGKKHLWRCADGGDYYAGETYQCLHCPCEVKLPSEPSKPDYTIQQAVEQIKAANPIDDRDV